MAQLPAPFAPCDVNPSTNRHLLCQGELNLFEIANVDVFENKSEKIHQLQKAILVITTHRLVLVSTSQLQAFEAPLWDMTKLEDKSNLLKSKLEPNFKTKTTGKTLLIELDHRKEKDTVMMAVDQALKRKEWTKTGRTLVRASSASASSSTAPVGLPRSISGGPAPSAKASPSVNRAPNIQTSGAMAVPAPQPSFVAAPVGVAGLIQREREKDRERGQTISDAFQDLDALMNSAKNLVTISEKLQASLKQEELKKGTLNSTELASFQSQNEELAEILQKMGIASPVTLVGSGKKKSVYHEQLARQLSEFLPPVLQKIGGITTTVDAFCMYNRARASTDLVAPDDFYAACKLFEPLRLPLKLVTMSDGISGIECPSSDEPNADRLQTMAQKQGSISALDLVKNTTVPMQSALKQLERAEELGRLCRDEHPELGIRFYPNLFPTFA